MRAIRRSAIIIGFMTWLLSTPGHAACGPGFESCEPSSDEARAKIERLLNSAFLTPHAIVSWDKLDGRRVETQGRNIYEMRFSVVLSYSGDMLVCRINVCPELHNYTLDVDKAARKATVAGWLFFEQAERAWR
jgi:hypothetical protein